MLCTVFIIVTSLMGLSMQAPTHQEGKEFSLQNKAYKAKSSVQQRKLTLLSWRNIDEATRISANIRIKHVFLMSFTHFLKVFPQKCPSHCNGPICPNYASTEKSTMERVFISRECIYCKVVRRNTFRIWTSRRIHVFSMIRAVCTLLSLLQFKRRLKLHV